MGYSLMVMKFFVSDVIEVSMSEYTVVVWDVTSTQREYWVVNSQQQRVNVAWATMEGATACAELLAEGYLKE